MRKKVLSFLCLYMLMICSAAAQTGDPKSSDYKNIAEGRADKIVEPLKITNVAKRKLVRDLVANQYVSLNKIHGERDKKIDQLKAKSASEDKLSEVAERATKQVKALHLSFLAGLSTELDKQQIDAVKDGMTYSTVPLTYKNYLLMLPYLAKEDQSKIWSFLIEAREYAMDGGSAKEKHAIFNKYKGKIANHLAAKGYDLKIEGKEWADRRDVNVPSLEIKESNRIIGVLYLNDSEKKESVRNLIALQYQKVEAIQNNRKLKSEENKKLGSKEEIDKADEAAWLDSRAKLEKQRSLYIDKLSDFLDKGQVEVVKNEMTDNGLQKEYTKFQKLLPGLKADQKQRVYEYLVEARENAMNVLTNRERNQWFAKYRGRANNYLSAQGYDLRKATEELEKRQKGN